MQVQINEDLQDKAEPVSDGAQEGDLVTINYTGTIDGKTFDSGTANNYDFVVGQGTMFDEFEQGVIGMKKGVTFTGGRAAEELIFHQITVTAQWQVRMYPIK